MKKLLIFLLLTLLIIAIGLVLVYYKSINKGLKAPENKEGIKINKNIKPSMRITSPAFLNNSKIPSKYTCDGENISPPLEFLDLPLQTRSLVLIVDDPDAPSKTWAHWVVYNIDPRVKEVKENTVPQGGELGTTDFGRPGYGGPCPPSGTHRYFFKLYALNAILDLPEGLNKQQILERMKDNILDQAQLIGLYSRK